MDKEILELLKGMAENINSLTMEVKELKEGQEKTNTRLGKIENRLDKIEIEQKETNKRLDSISKGIGKLVADEVGESILEIKADINDIKTEVEIIKLSVGEHEMDIKYLKKVK